MTWRRVVLAAALVPLAACAAGDAAVPGSSTAASDATPRPSTAAATAAASAPTTSTTTTSTTTTTTTTTTSSAIPTTTIAMTTTIAATTTSTSTGGTVAGLATDAVQTLEIGRSREDRPIVAVERGTPGGAVVLVIGVIHGDEDDGVAILEQLATAPVPAGVDLWLIESMNPDGQAADQRWNADGVDLNRNFPFQWGPIGAPGDDEYAGPGPASEPETRAIVDFVARIRPALGLWYHQDLFRLSPGQGLEGELKARYSERTGLPILRITGGTYTGVAATWQRNTIEGISFIVELGPTLDADEATVHSGAVLELASIVAGS